MLQNDFEKPSEGLFRAGYKEIKKQKNSISNKTF
jgi:hypothetical protein